MKTNLHLLILVAAAGLLTACNRDNTAPSTPPPSQTAADAARDSAAQTRDQFLASMDKKMAELDAKIDKLEAKSATAEGDAKVRADQAIADLRSQREAVRKEYHELKASSQDAWDKTKAGFQSAWDSLVKTYDNAVAKMSSS
jgi:chromosome segregation ATPase